MEGFVTDIWFDLELGEFVAVVLWDDLKETIEKCGGNEPHIVKMINNELIFEIVE